MAHKNTSKGNCRGFVRKPISFVQHNGTAHKNCWDNGICIFFHPPIYKNKTAKPKNREKNVPILYFQGRFGLTQEYLPFFSIQLRVIQPAVGLFGAAEILYNLNFIYTRLKLSQQFNDNFLFSIKKNFIRIFFFKLWVAFLSVRCKKVFFLSLYKINKILWIIF